MHNFLLENRIILIDRCKAKVAMRPRRTATDSQLAYGIPIFLEQLTRTFLAENNSDEKLSTEISGASGGDDSALSEMGMGATAHGEELLKLGYTVDQVVHDYGDLCQAITELAFEVNAPFKMNEFRTLNRCLDNAIAEAVTAFTLHHDVQIITKQRTDEKLRLGFLAHELRNSLGTATLAVKALESGSLSVGGATGAILKRSLSTLSSLISRSIAELNNNSQRVFETFSVDDFISDAGLAARLDASLVNCELEIRAVDPALIITANKDLLHAAVANLLQNAFKFTQLDTVVTLHAYAVADRLIIDISDHCGGLSRAEASRMFFPFPDAGGPKAGLGLGLSIARQSIEADFGTLSFLNIPDKGCVFTINLPLQKRDS